MSTILVNIEELTLDNGIIGFVILNYNSNEDTIKLARSLSTYDITAGIQIIDNASLQSCKDIEELCMHNSSRIHFKRMDTNLGYARGNNAGASELLRWLDCPILAIANPDIDVSSKALHSCVDALLADDECAAIAPVMLRSSDGRPTYPWRLPSKKSLLSHTLPLIGKYFSKKDAYSEEKFVNGGICQVDVLPGSLLLIKSKDFKDVGGFNEETFLYGEEKLLSGRLISRGKTIAFDTTSNYSHCVSSSININIPSIIKRFDYMRDSNDVYAREYLHAGIAYRVLYRILSFVSTRIIAISLSLKRV